MLKKVIEKLKWGIDRWKNMEHPMEELYRLRQQYQYRVKDLEWTNCPPSGLQLKYNPITKHITNKGVKEVVNASINELNEYHLLNVIVDDIINNNKWNYDFKNNIQGQCRFVHQIDEFSESSGDSRYFYELGRLHFLPVALAYAIANDDISMAGKLKGTIYDWSRQNPFLMTLAWKSGNEVGIRVINLIYFRLLLDVIGDDDRDFDLFFARLIELHFHFIVSHLSLYSSKGNHHIGEIAGVITICSCFLFKNSDIILKKYVDEIETEIIRLIYYDGFNKEQSTNYQTSYINLIVTALLFAKHRGIVAKNECWNRIEKAYDYLDLLRVKKGEFFHIGDTDNAELIYPYADVHYNIYESQLNDAVVLFGKKKKEHSYFDLRNYLLFGDKGLNIFKKAAEDDSNKVLCVFKKDSGNFVIKDNNVCLLFDSGSIGLLPLMSHGHADIFNILLYVNGNPILVDCGCYQYNINFKKYRNYFHGTSSHNTICIDGRNQAQLGTGMFWLSCPKVNVVDYSTEGEVPHITAVHDGFKKVTSFTHRREVVYPKKENKIVVKDVLIGKETSKMSFYLHFHPDADVKHIGDTLYVDGVLLTNDIFHLGRLVKGNDELPLGWYSPRYDCKLATTSFVVEAIIRKELVLKTIIKF